MAVLRGDPCEIYPSRVSPELIALVPARFASKHAVIPLFLDNDGPNGQLLALSS